MYEGKMINLPEETMEDIIEDWEKTYFDNNDFLEEDKENE